MSSTPVASEFDICCTSFFKKLTELSGILKDPVGIHCSISGNELSNLSAFCFSFHQRIKGKNDRKKIRAVQTTNLRVMRSFHSLFPIQQPPNKRFNCQIVKKIN